MVIVDIHTILKTEQSIATGELLDRGDVGED
jgi:hypothetical protein